MVVEQGSREDLRENMQARAEARYIRTSPQKIRLVVDMIRGLKAGDAINILRSVSRVMPGCNSDAEQDLVVRAKKPLTIYEDMAELIRLGAYKAGTNPEVDGAVKLYPQLEAFLAQKKDEQATLSEGYAALKEILGAEGRAG